MIDANQHLYVTSTEAYKEGREARRERTREERAAAWAEWESKRAERLAKVLAEGEDRGEGVTD